jgi:hypothetical protein
MNVLLGMHVGTQDKIPKTDAETVAFARSLMTWQEYNGPMIIAVDEPFYLWLEQWELDLLYQDVIPLNMEYESEEDVREHFSKHVPYDLYFVGLDEISVMGEPGKTYSLKESFEQKDFVDLQLELLPDKVQTICLNIQPPASYSQEPPQQTWQ